MTHLKCPKCEGTLEAVVYSTIPVDRCTSCKGIWFSCAALLPRRGRPSVLRFPVYDWRDHD
ncbi:MAG: zf-TFIIB domain-containing protein [Moorea sp. SIO3C2]|nr:zf-TFIIB domain-containing protein [Moorena sp. SIO3C2]